MVNKYMVHIHIQCKSWYGWEFCVIIDLREKLTGTDSNCSLLVRPGERQDNIFLQYGVENKPNSQEEYDAPRWDTLKINSEIIYLR